MKLRQRMVAVAIAAASTVGLLAASSPAAQATDSWTSSKAKLTLVHGIAGTDNAFPVDISVYRLGVGSQVFEDVTYGTVAGPLVAGRRHLPDRDPPGERAAVQLADPVAVGVAVVRLQPQRGGPPGRERCAAHQRLCQRHQ